MRRLLALVAMVALGIAAVATSSGSPRVAGLVGEPRVVTDTVAAGCDVVPVGEEPDRTHVDAATAPPPEELYAYVPPTSGRHYAAVHPLVIDARLTADVRATTHNLEHGAVVVHVDAARLGPISSDAVEDWARELATAGFRAERVGVGVIVVAMPPDTTRDPVVALRAWGVGLDCAGWDRATADAFVVEHYGDRGVAPEGDLAPFPDGNGLLLEGAFV